MKNKLTMAELAKSLNVTVEELPSLDRVTVQDGSAEYDVNVQACLRECSDYVAEAEVLEPGTLLNWAFALGFVNPEAR